MPSTAAVVAPDLLQSLSNSPAAKAAGATATSTKLDNEQWRALSQSQGDDQGHSQGIGSNLHGHSSYFGLRSTASAASTAETPVVASGAPRSFLSLSGPILPASRNDIVSSPAHSSSSSTFPPTSSSSAAGLPPTSPFVYGTGASAFEGSRASGSGSSSSYGPLSSGVAIAAAGVRAGAGEALAVGLACAAPEATLDASTFYSLPPSAVSTATDSAAVTRTSAARSSGPSFASPLPITARINESVHYISAPASSSSEAYTNTLTMSQAQGLGSALSSVFDQGHGSEHSQAQGQRPHFPPAPAPSAFVHAYGLEHDQQYQYQRRQQCQQQQQQGQAASVQSTFTGPMGTESANSFNMPSGSGSTSGGSGGGTAGSSGAGSSRSGTGAADTSTGMSSAADEFSTYASPPSSAGDAGPASTPGPGPNAGRKANTRGSRLGAQLAKSISPAGLGSDPGAQEAHYQQHSHPPTGSAGGAGTASENAWSGSANGSVGSQPLSQFSEIGRTSSATAVASAEAFGGAGAEMGNMTGTVPFPSAAKSLPYAGGAIAAESLHFVDARSPLAPSEGAGGRDDGTFFITAGGGNPAGPSKYGSPAQAGSTTTNNPISGSAALGQSRSPSSSSGGSRVASLASRWGGTTLASSGGSIAGTGTVSSTSTAAGASGPASAAGTYAPDEASAPGNGSGRSISSAFGFRTPKRQTTLDSLSSSSGGYRASKVRAAFEPGSSEAESEPRTLPGSRPRTRVGGEGAAETAATPTPMASSSDFDSGNVAFANSDTEGDRVVHAKNGSLSPTVETRRRDSRLGKASSHSDLLFFAASQAQSQPNSHTLSPTNVTSPRRSPSSGIPVSPNADRLPLDSASSLQQRFAAARAAGRLSRLQYNRPDSEQTSDWEAMRGATSPPLGTTSAVAAAAADRGNSSIVDNVKEDDNISSARRPLDGSTPSSMSPSSTRQQRELLLPVLQGARNGQAFLKDDPNPYFSAISVAASRNGGIGDGVGGGEQQAPTRLKRNDEELDSGAGGPEPAGFLSPQSHSHDVTSVASTRSTMPSASLPLSPPSSATATEPSSRSHDASLGSSLRTGLLSDRDIAILGAIPGSPPESLLNADGTPLNSKNILTIALQKAQNAVMLDGANNVPEAIAAYKQAVRLLQEVMERISPRPGKKTRSSREEERRRLRVIHDTYADRIRLLSMIYVSEDGVELSASSSPLASLAGDWLPSPAVERVGVMPTEKSGEVVTGPGPKVVDSNEQPSRLHASTPSSGSHHEALAKHHAAYSEPRLSKDSSKGRRSVRAASFETARYDGAQTLDAAPAIAIAPGSPMDADPSGTYGGHQGERKDGAAAKDTPVRSRASSDASACSRYSSAKLSPQNALKNLQGPTSEAPFLSARSQAFGLDEEVKTPATPYFDVDPNLRLPQQAKRLGGCF
ncbi:hypothetical protein K437DRAFT_88711 [Tilletiaria anomala UBC 951]|uniref:MIT domain-containing protein n=1 Tax=Tilletiaria anomala (strain ATCC 24038 / CBS 436.72 / UBC 951) TaxID=1037660 RepID=A0A066WAV7_TILAU|nr:uncharacterized protein K437DRAFT_88711 [Tilletiaria anomala UBC 951]KDN48224.1 hypothetical protein K437DRAFT_88711 [Tilletiaria anomala UBC 951]